MKKNFTLPPNTHLRLFLDECLSSDLVQSLRLFLTPDYPNLVIEHLAEYFERGEGDDVWLPKLQKEVGWIVITKDHGRDPKKPKLPDICKNLGVTHVIISESISTNTEIKHSLVNLLPHMLAIPFLPKGTQVRLNLQSLKKTGTPFPTLTVAGKRIDIWCLENDIIFPDSSAS